MTVSVSQFKCPNCGAVVRFDPNKQEITCDHCGTSFDIDNIEQYVLEEKIESDSFDWSKYQRNQIEADGQITYICPSCGGEVVGDKTLGASSCPYCGNNIIIEDKFKGLQKPDFIIPFKYTKEEAKKAYIKYLKGKKLLAKDFESSNIIDKINGLYVPYWLFSCECKCQARYNATRINRFSTSDYDIEEISHYLVYRDGEISFDKVPVDGSNKLPDKLLESLEPYNYQDGVDFKTAYLSGFFANEYDYKAEDAIIRANQRIKNSTISRIDSTLFGYSSFSKTSSNVRFENGKVDYALLPIYIFSSHYKNKIYNFAMNGQTGKFSGNLPVDNKKTIIYSLLIFIISFLIIMTIMVLVI